MKSTITHKVTYVSSSHIEIKKEGIHIHPKNSHKFMSMHDYIHTFCSVHLVHTHLQLHALCTPRLPYYEALFLLYFDDNQVHGHFPKAPTTNNVRTLWPASMNDSFQLNRVPPSKVLHLPQHLESYAIL